MRARVEKVSPDLARKWLEKSEVIQQRGIRKNRVDKLAHAILAGQWQITHQGLAMSPEGYILDGQHRLHAIIQADVTVEVLVVRDVPNDVFQSIDTGASRTPADSLRIAGYKDVNVLAAAVRALLVYDQVVGTQAKDWWMLDRQVTTSDTLAWVEDDESRELAYAAIKSGRGIAGAVFRTGTTSALSAANLILLTHPTDVGSSTRAEFNTRLMDGVMLPARSPILALRRWLVADTGYVNVPAAIRRPVTIAVYLKAINDYAMGLERSLSIFRMGIDLMPPPLPLGSIEKASRKQEAELAVEEREEAMAQ